MAEAYPESTSSVENTNTTSDNNGETKSNPYAHRKDFKETAQYKDLKSYASQHHHSIGSGLYLTDEVKDLPPRFQNKVIMALVNAAALNKIPLHSDPLKLICDADAAAEGTSSKKEVRDSLVTFSTSIINPRHGNNIISKPPLNRNPENKGSWSSNSVQPRKSSQQIEYPECTADAISVVHPKYVTVNNKNIGPFKSAQFAQSTSKKDRTNLNPVVANSCEATATSSEYNDYLNVDCRKQPHNVFVPLDYKKDNTRVSEKHLEKSFHNKRALKQSDSISSTDSHLSKPNRTFNERDHKPMHDKNVSKGDNRFTSQHVFAEGRNDSHNSSQKHFNQRPELSNSIKSVNSKKKLISEQKPENILHKLFPPNNSKSCDMDQGNPVGVKSDANSKDLQKKTGCYGRGRNQYTDLCHNQQKDVRSNSVNSADLYVSNRNDTSVSNPKSILNEIFNVESGNNSHVSQTVPNITKLASFVKGCDNFALADNCLSQSRKSTDSKKSTNASFRPVNKEKFSKNSDKICSKSQNLSDSANFRNGNKFDSRNKNPKKFNDRKGIDENHVDSEWQHHNSGMNDLSKTNMFTDKFSDEAHIHKKNTQTSRNIQNDKISHSVANQCSVIEIKGVYTETDLLKQVHESSRTSLNTHDLLASQSDESFSHKNTYKKSSDDNDCLNYSTNYIHDISSKASNYSNDSDMYQQKNPKVPSKHSQINSDRKFNKNKNHLFQNQIQSTKSVKSDRDDFNENEVFVSETYSQCSRDSNSRPFQNHRNNRDRDNFDDHDSVVSETYSQHSRDSNSRPFPKHKNNRGRDNFNHHDSVVSETYSQHSRDSNSKPFSKHRNNRIDFNERNSGVSETCSQNFRDSNSKPFPKHGNNRDMDNFNGHDSVVSETRSQHSRDSNLRQSSKPRNYRDRDDDHNSEVSEMHSQNSRVPNSKSFPKHRNNRKRDFNDNDSVVSETHSQHSRDSNSRQHRNYRIDERNIKNNKTYSSHQNQFEDDERQNSHHKGCVENGFFLKIAVSEEARDLEYWVNALKRIFNYQFDVERCCHFSDILILTFERKENALKGHRVLSIEKEKSISSERPHITNISKVKYHIIRPCDCRETVLQDSIYSIEKNASLCQRAIAEKMDVIKHSNDYMSKTQIPRSKHQEVILAKNEILKTYKDSESNFLNFKAYVIKKLATVENLKSVQQWKLKFIIECNTFKRCLPIYSKKEDILKSVRYNSVSIVVAETGSGKSTQLAEYILHSSLYDKGLIICTQPRKLATISIAQYVSGQMGSAVGKIVGYDCGMDKKCSDMTKILYMTDYCLLRTCLRNQNLRNVSFIIIDEAHERSLYTDLLLATLKQLLHIRPDLRVIVTSATINPGIFLKYFDMPPEAEINVPGRSYPVDVVWMNETVNLGWNYLQACVKKAYEVHQMEKRGDILVFLTSPNEAEEAINIFKNCLTSRDEKVLLLCLHGKSDIKEQMQVLQVALQNKRKIIFSTNVAETSITIPGIRYVIDSGMTKELMFDPKKNKSYLSVNFINKSSAEQRKGRAGRTQSGVCYRLYSKANLESMADNAVPEILKTNLQKAMLKIFELGIQPSKFDFIEAPSDRTISNSIDSLEYLGAIENNKLTLLGKNLVKLPLEPQLSKLILLGIESGIGYEAIIIAALLSESGKLFLRFEDNKVIADEMKKKFSQTGGDLCTYLEVYKRWKNVDFPSRYDWCVNNCLSFKALNSASKTVFEILFCLRNDLGISVVKNYSVSFKKTYERVLFNSFSENLCVSSGHPQLGYLSPFLSESFFIHPSSVLSYLGKKPDYLVYNTLMETTRNFLFDVTPISEETIELANKAGNFTVPLHSLKCLQITPKIMGPYGESVLIRHILGKNGSKVKDIESRIKSFTNTKNIRVDVAVDKGLITIYVGKRFHDKISKDINEIIEKGLVEMLNEEDVIKVSGTSLYYALGAGGLISDIIMPGEYRELILRSVSNKNSQEVEDLLKSYGPVHSFDRSFMKQSNKCEISITYKTVSDARKAFLDLKKQKLCSVSTKPCLPNISDRTLSLYILSVSWCRCPCSGKGWVEFNSQLDLVLASGILTNSSFYLDENYVMFEPSPESNKKLLMSNLPKNADENAVKAKLYTLLPSDLPAKRIHILRSRSIAVTDGGIEDAKKKLQKLFQNFTVPAKLIVDVKYPKPANAFWEASVCFENFEDGEEAFQHVKDNASIDSYPLDITRVLKSSVDCKMDVYQAVSVCIAAVLESKQKEGTCKNSLVTVYKEKGNVKIDFETTTLAELMKLKQTLMLLVQGDSLDFIGVSKYNFLFSESLLSSINRISKSTKTVIHVNKYKKVITIYGFLSDCKKAKEEIYALARNSDLCLSRVFNLQDSGIPAGFLKKLYTKYGYDLHGLVDSFELKMAVVECSKLTLTGKKDSIKQAEQALENFCEELYKTRGKRQESKDDEASCPICLEPVSYDFFRLEHCGHAFCRQCLLLQLESKYIPFICVKQNCGKLIFLEDIKRVISFGGDKKAFCAAALQYYVNHNSGKISYCLTPDCQMMYRVTAEGSEFHCPECRNSLCTKCRKMYHYGMTCEMFENCQKDEDYSLKSWMKENKTNAKPCPSCSIVIEKDSGCNHMECLKCMAHFCWLCLQKFETDKMVYQHFPYCPKNQS